VLISIFSFWNILSRIFFITLIRYINICIYQIYKCVTGQGWFCPPLTLSVVLKGIWHNVNCIHFLPASLVGSGRGGPLCCSQLKIESCPFKRLLTKWKRGKRERKGRYCEEGKGVACVCKCSFMAFGSGGWHPGRPQMNWGLVCHFWSPN